MSKKKISLVLEGGGFRGAYTAGCLSWLIDNGIEFDCCYGISVGAVHMCTFLMKDKDMLYDLTTNQICKPRFSGLQAILHTGRIVDYDFFFDHLLKEELGYDIQKAIDADKPAKVGIYDLALGKTVYYHVKDVDMNTLKASTTLPILGKIVKVNGHQILDGGITDMIPIEKAIDDGMERHLIITTKPGDYVRKKSLGIVNWLMGVFYPTCPNIKRDYSIRHLNYLKQIDLIKKLSSAKEAVHIYPSQSMKVSRLSGDPETLVALYELGRKDMEAHKEDICALLG